MFITVELLKSKGACESQIKLFKKLFPKGVEATEEVCISVAHRFDFSRAAQILLNDKQRKKYAAENKAITEDYYAGLGRIDYLCPDSWAMGFRGLGLKFDIELARSFGRIGST